MRPVEEDGDHEREHWESLLELCEGYRELHAAEPPLERRALSWARCTAFAQVILGARGERLHRGTSTKPRVIWVLAATDEVEGALAAEGYFKDASWLDRAASEVVILGSAVRQLSPGPASNGQHCAVRATSYAHLKDLPSPHLAMVFMPDRQNDAFEPGDGHSLDGSSRAIPRDVMSMLVGVPVVVSTCFKPSPRFGQRLRSLGNLLLLQETRCPFSSAGDLQSQFADNSWITAVRGPDALEFLLNLEICCELPSALPEEHRLPAVFWGILDLKYDGSKPILERVRVLETGDGRISKFSGDGAAIQELMRSRYTSKESGVLRKFHVISADKKLTHDLMELAGYNHIVPGQVCYPRHYDMKLAQRISSELNLDESDKVVLKLCNRSRAAGVIVAPVDELDEVLEEILIPPPKMDGWLQEKNRPLQEGRCSAGDLNLVWGSFEEQKRHWWANESPCFVAERWCTSTPLQKGGKFYDGTMRVGFVVLYKRDLRTEAKTDAVETGSAGPGPDVPQPEELAVHWLGGYWKLPKRDMRSADLRERVVSAARTSGTAPVRSAVLAEVYSSLGDSVQQLFGGVEPSSKMLADHYASQPELAAYLTARLAVSIRESSRMKKMLYDAQVLVGKGLEERGKQFVESFIARCHGVLEARSDAKDRWDSAKRHFLKALKCSPANANALYLLGMASLELGKPAEAVTFMNKSLLLDPDFRAPYVNLGAAYLRLRLFEETIAISEACLERHPSSPQCVYHIGVACCQLSLLNEARESGGVPLSHADKELSDELRKRALECLLHARQSEEGQKRKPNPGTCRVPEAPWLESDRLMIEILAADHHRPPEVSGGYTQDSTLPREVRLPPTVGWKIFGWRT
mmetsp:Transcript_1234/g.3169  ORF Transcript_1234/g.3169 Transcript_1234/m.3169 type:complete len:862 (-) Transcript_1234:17-2602(-)